MSEPYIHLKDRHLKEINDFPMFFAFSHDQFEEGLEKFGLSMEDASHELISIGGGGYIRKTDVNAFNEMFKRHEEELQQAIDNDKTGEGFIFDMFYYELANHEFAYSREIESTLDALGLTLEQINENMNLSNGLTLAMESIIAED